jgi:DNA gyrase subunit A
VIKLIKASKDPEEAKNVLLQRFSLTEKQAKAILDMRLQRLTSLEAEKIVNELKELMDTIKALKEILESHSNTSNIIKEEFAEIGEEYSDSRRSEIIPISGDLSIEDIIADEEMVVTITHNGYIKRLPTATWKTQRRGGRGMKGAHTKEDDFIEHLFTASTHDTMLFFTDRGKCYWMKVHEIPPGQRTSQGRAIVNLIGCETGEKVKAFVSVKEFNETDYIVMATRKGIIKRSSLSMYSRPRKGGIYAIEIRKEDELIQAKISHGDQDFILATHNGKSIRFSENNVRPTGRKTMGVRGIRLSSKQDNVIGMLVVKREGSILVVTNQGYGKRSSLEDYRTQNRGGKGVITIKTTKKVGQLIGIMEAIDGDDLMLITDKGIMIRQPVEHIRTIGRNTQGVRLAKLDSGTKISSATRILKDENEEENKDKEISSPQEQCFLQNPRRKS